MHFIYHQQEMGAFLQDQWKINDRFSITPGIRYDWQSFFAQKRLAFSPRVSFAWILNDASKTVIRGGGGVYYDRTGSGSLLDLVRYQGLEPRRRAVTLSLDPASQPATGCVPITQCVDVASAPLARVEFDPYSRMPYQLQYGMSVERQLGEKATAVVSVYSMRDVGAFRSIDVNAPTPESDFTQRPDPAYGRVRQMQSEGFLEGSGLDVSYRGRLNKYFTGFGRYTWSHYESNTDGIGFFPESQLDPGAEWSNSGFDRRQRVGMYAMIHPDGVLNLSAGIFANSGRPWSVLTGTDPFGTSLFNARPSDTPRNTENMPSYVDLDLRWGHDFAITPNKNEDAPRLGLSAGAFNILNHTECGQHRPGGDFAGFRPGYVRKPAATNPARHALRVLKNSKLSGALQRPVLGPRRTGCPVPAPPEAGWWSTTAIPLRSVTLVSPANPAHPGRELPHPITRTGRKEAP